MAGQGKEFKMKTRKWVYVLIGVLATLGLIKGAGLNDTGWFSSSAALAESVSEEGSTTTELKSNETEYQGVELESENINQILREFEALKDTEYQGLELEPENINQILREFEALKKIKEERDHDLFERQMRFNLPEGIN
jgi:hypothetical protein